jgi:predicted TIM-barrel fold metal-dependent hydrolase
MPYHAGRLIHDADAHIMEWPTWLLDHADPAIRARIQPADYGDDGAANALSMDRLRAKHESEEYRADEEAEIMARKNFWATGSFIREDRGRALDLLGFASQLVFNTFNNNRFWRMEHGDNPFLPGDAGKGEGDLDLAYGVAEAHNRGMVEFCAADRRLLPTLYVPLADFDRSRKAAEDAVAAGAAALLVPSACPEHHSPSHLGLDPVWATAQEAGIPVVFHVGGGGKLLDLTYFQNGLPIPPDFHGGAENFRSVDYMAIPNPPQQTLATMIFDGVLDRFPDLKFGVIEQGAIWLPSWIKQMESAVEAFGRHEERLQKLELRPRDYVERQVRATPYPTEDVGWITDQVGPDICLFSSDFPHVEGGRKPVERFEASLGERSEAIRDRFYRDNFVDLMGSALASLAAA